MTTTVQVVAAQQVLDPSPQSNPRKEKKGGGGGHIRYNQVLGVFPRF